MSENDVKEATAAGKLKCPQCQKSVKKYEKYSETVDAVRDGFNITQVDSRAVRVTLVCGNDPCSWKERTEYWESFVQD